WTGSSGATGYDVFRSTDGTSFSRVASNVTGTSYSDTQYLRMAGSGTVSASNSSSLQVTGDIDIRVKVSLDNWSSPFATLVDKSPSQYNYGFAVANGRLWFEWSPDASASYTSQSSETLGFSNGSTHWVRVTRVASTGAVSFYTSVDGVDWTQLGTTVSGPSGSIYEGPYPLYVGGGFGVYSTGDFYEAEVLSGINGTVVADPDFSGAPAASFTDPEGNTWSITGSASLQGGPPLSSGTTYYYEVQAVDSGGASGYSSTASAQTNPG
ncbi:MAG: hypothetical protein ACRDV4_04760, partial [Acidimicrobiales bacterium]